MTARRLVGLLAGVLILVAALVVGCSSLPFLGRVAPTEWVHERTEDLPEFGDLGGGLLADALAERRSVRDFEARDLTVAEVAALLWAAQGTTSPAGGRTSPSAGALYPLDVYLVTSTDVARYLTASHQVQVHDSTDARRRLAGAVGQDAAVNAPALLVITGTADRLLPKYLGRAERYTLLEAGHAAQNVLLAATALGLGGVTIGAFDGSQVAAALDLPRGEDPIYVIPIGAPASGS